MASNYALLRRKTRNWTKYIQERQIFGSSTSPMKIISSGGGKSSTTTTTAYEAALRSYRLQEIVSDVYDLEKHVYLGFSVCGNYLYSYVEMEGDEIDLVPGAADVLGGHSILDSGIVYVLHVWSFIPGFGKLKKVYETRLFDGESFNGPISLRIQQRPDAPNICLVIGSELLDAHSNTVTRTVCYTILFTYYHHHRPPTTTAHFNNNSLSSSANNGSSLKITTTFRRVINFHSRNAICTDLRAIYGRYLTLVTCDDLVLVDLQGMYDECGKLLNQGIDRSPWMICNDSYGDISKMKLTGARSFSYASQTLEWCSKTCQAMFNSTCVGLSDYHLFLDTISEGTCTGSVLALLDVDTDQQRRYFEILFTFVWHFDKDHHDQQKVVLVEVTPKDVTSRANEPGKQQKAFDDLRKRLLAQRRIVLPSPPNDLYQLSNISVLQGFSLGRILDYTGHIELTL